MQKDTENIAVQLKPFRFVATLLASLILLSTIFFHTVEKWNWIDSYYYTIITIATVGYGDFTPSTNIGKIGSTFVILIGIGLFGAFANMLIKRRTIIRAEKLERRNK
jgi:voltage-gated potassium channel